MCQRTWETGIPHPGRGNDFFRAELGLIVVLTTMLWSIHSPTGNCSVQGNFATPPVGGCPGYSKQPPLNEEQGDFFQRVVCSREKQATPHFYQKNQWHASKCKKEVPFLLWLRFLKQMHSDNGLKTSTFPGIEQATPMKCMCKLWWQIETKNRAEAPLSFSPSQTKATSTAGLSWRKQSWQQTALLFCTES